MFLASANRRKLLGDDVITEWVDLDKPAFYMWSMAGFYSWNMMIAFMTIFKVRSRSKSGGCGCESGSHSRVPSWRRPVAQSLFRLTRARVLLALLTVAQFMRLNTHIMVLWNTLSVAGSKLAVLMLIIMFITTGFAIQVCSMLVEAGSILVVHHHGFRVIQPSSRPARWTRTRAGVLPSDRRAVATEKCRRKYREARRSAWAFPRTVYLRRC